MTKPPTKRRSPLISLLVFVFALIISLVVVALLQLDLGSYKLQLAERLAQTLNMPVKLGDASLSFHNGIALDFRNLQIGNDSTFRLDVPKFTVLIKPLKLLHGEIAIDQIHLDSPQLRVALPIAFGESTLNLDRLELKTLQIRNGSLLLTTEKLSEAIKINDFNLVLHGPGKGRISQVAITANLQLNNQNADLNAFLKLDRAQLGQPWRQWAVDGNVVLRRLQIPVLETLDIVTFPRQLDLSIGVKGTPAETVQLDAELANSLTAKPLAQLTADWHSAANIDSFRNLRLGVANIPLTGDLQLNRQGDEPQLSGQLGASKLDLKSLFNESRLALHNLSGQLESFEMVLDGPLHPTAENPLAPLSSAALNLQNLAYPLGVTDITDTSLQIELKNARIHLTEGHGTLGRTPFSVSGSTGPLQLQPLDLSFELTGTADLTQLQEESSSPFLKRQKLTGKVPFAVILNGPLSDPTSVLNLDFTDTDLSVGNLFEKSAGTPFRLNLKGQFVPHLLRIDQASIILAQSHIQLAGNFSQSEQNWSGALQLAPLEMEQLQAVSPLLKHLQINGKASGELTLSPDNWSGRLDLTGAGAHLTPIIGDLNQTQGTFFFDRNGISFEGVSTSLGESPLNVSGGLSSWKAPLLSLHVTGKELRAQDLVFTNPEMKLQNLDGQLLINAGGITFDPVVVTVENRTIARVSGQIRDYHNPQTYLEIQSDDADILDVIRLFIGPPKILSPAATASDASLEIKAQVKRGRLGSLFFENTQGTILDRNNIFTLFPLDVHLAEGLATGRVELDRTRNNLLKISGMAQDCNADLVYEMLFEEKGIFRGTLSGDFYLEGEEIGESFWKTAQGGGHLKIRNGAMRGLNGFAKIFSLLNVAQLFKFNLPDMDKEGLPLSLLESSARMTDGIVYFDDFRITSPAINISAVGQLNTLEKTIDSTLGIKPLRTVDIILSNVPLFGWVLTGDEEALITALFTLKGPIHNPSVSAAPASSIANTALGIIGRALGLPLRMLQKTGNFLTAPPRPGAESPPPVNKEQDTQ